MRLRTVLTIVAAGAVGVAGLVVAPLTFAAQAPGNACPDVEIIGARGTTERPGLGVVLTPLAQQITRAVPQTVRTTALDYPATFNYTASVQQGVTALAADVRRTAAACRNTRFVLMGYSQGANVVGDALAGRSVRGRAAGQPAIPANLASRVAAVLLFGDPTFTAGEDFNITDGTRNGILSRGAGRLDAFAGRTQSFCNRNDRFCQGGTSLAAHLDYAKFRAGATGFVADRVG
ncbi:cutinase family protein [Couchioplanes caeruleus]|uniref:cutinase family protein n=1 Tax=Couchioplanes caeruleus TaxID=56438 RepID=UPI0020BE6F04|nr:cutinase family protein [Couchioplanes caeruleus]UQU61396.1 cutinase family protein [Couchioplanes caeruleus]